MSATSPPWGQYAKLVPDKLAAIRAEVPVVYVPWGALEWHGPHLPLGLDGTVAEAVAERVAQRTGGVLLPTTWWPAGVMPHPDSLGVGGGVLRRLWDDIFADLARAGWHMAVVISGHYSQPHELMLMEAAEHAMACHNLLVLGLPPLALVDEEMLDHAALWETSLLLALQPEQVNLEALGPDAMPMAQSAVLGRDPRALASASLGTTALDLGVTRIAAAVTQLLTMEHGHTAALQALYVQRRARYKTYIERYGDLPSQEAVQLWWQDMINAEHSLENGATPTAEGP